jgi:type IV secretion system protein VirD4
MNLGLVVLTTAGAVGTLAVAAVLRKLSRKLERRLIVTTFVGLAVGALAWVYLAYGLLAFLGALLVVATVGVSWVRWRRSGSADTVNRWGETARRRSGVATTLTIARVASAPAMRRKATVVRPSLAELPLRQRLMLPVTEFAVPLCKSGRLTVYSSSEDVTLIFGGPRKGKSGWLAGRIIDAPGACLVTSTRTNLLKLTGPLREKNRAPVYIFNPALLGDLASTITFDPLHGCENPQTAIERAIDMIPSKDDTGGERDFWDHQARRVLAALMHAAALGGGTRTMRDVLRWVSVPKDAGREVQRLLKRSPEPAFEPDVEQFVRLNDTTQSSVTTGVMPALQWLTSPGAAAAASGAHPFDVRELLKSRATVYLLGAEEAQSAPLVCALTGFIAREARRIAATLPGGRIDPHLTLALDEAALISPVPLPNWTADMGGRGVTIIAAFQSRAQMLQKYGQAGSAVTLNNAGSVMLFGGTKDRDDLNYWSSLAGDRDEVVKTRNGDGKVTSTSVRKTAVLSVAQLATLPRYRVVVFRSDMPPAVGRAEMAWERRDVRAAARITQTAPARPVTHPVPLPFPAPTQSPAPVGAAPARELTDVTH